MRKDMILQVAIAALGVGINSPMRSVLPTPVHLDRRRPLTPAQEEAARKRKLLFDEQRRLDNERDEWNANVAIKKAAKKAAKGKL